MTSAQRSARAIVAAIVVLAAPCVAAGQSSLAGARVEAGTTAFVNVRVLTMAAERVDPDQTVVVRGDRIVTVGPASGISIPSGATIVDGHGALLVPGLTDAHVHLTMGMPWAPTRPDFGDAPIYLRYGVTTVFNLSGSPAEIEIRDRIVRGDLVAPTVYTAGPFINEPRVTTPEAIRDEIAAQAAAGYDLIKFHELPGTTKGLSLPAYKAMMAAARAHGIPLVGHAPVRLGVGVMLEEHQALAHTGTLMNIYFLPLVANFATVVVTNGALAVLLVGAIVWTFRLVRIARRGDRSEAALASKAVGALAIVTCAAAVAAAVVSVAFLPGGPFFEGNLLRVVFTALAAAIGILTIALAYRAGMLWRSHARVGTRFGGLTTALAATVLSYTLFAFWIPLSWRSSASRIDRLAERVHEAGISVQSTLVVYQSIERRSRAAFLDDPAVRYVLPATREIWRRAAAGGAPFSGILGFNETVIRALHRRGVSIVAGTDAMGLELVAPGSSLHRELQLLVQSGMTPYEAIRAATVAPAEFLRAKGDFGTIAVGKRADLLLVSGNPLGDLRVLADPLGVMVRGKWLPRLELEFAIERLLVAR